MTEEILSAVDGQLFAVWFLIGAALVFWMQAGFAMVETGFTRAKNAGNILMKNLMDFCIGTVVFILIGFGSIFRHIDKFGEIAHAEGDLDQNRRQRRQNSVMLPEIYGRLKLAGQSKPSSAARPLLISL